MLKKRNLKPGLVILFMLVLITSVGIADVKAADNTYLESIMESGIKDGSISDINRSISKYTSDEAEKIFRDFNPEAMTRDFITGGSTNELNGLWGNILKYFTVQIKENLGLFARLIALAVMWGLLDCLRPGLGEKGTGEIFTMAGFAVMIAILASSLKDIIVLVRETIQSLISYMHSTIPLLGAAAIAGGGFVSGGVIKPALLAAAEAGGSMIINIFLPLITMSLTLSIAENISGAAGSGKFAGLLRSVTAWALGIYMTIFTAISSLQAISGGLADGVAGKTAKFAIGAFIPVVGKYLADATDTIMGCAVILRSAGTVAAMIGVFVVCLAPMVKLAALILIYRIGAALIAVIADKRISSCVDDMASCISWMVGLAFCMAAMTVICMAALAGSGMVAAMVR